MGLDMKLLSNAPLGEDLLEGKSQELIADAIVEQLKLNANQRNPDLHHKMIGIEEAWGSGKSNLVEIVKKKLNENAAFHFFTYDVWGHHNLILKKIEDKSPQKHFKLTKEQKEELVQQVASTYTKRIKRTILGLPLGAGDKQYPLRKFKEDIIEQLDNTARKMKIEAHKP